jgi:NADH:ubiquinone reductase (H+-translocating)
MNVLIIGGGFGGLEAAKVLGGDQRFQVTLIDRKNFHLFQPLLYQVATAGLSPADIAVPIRSILSAYSNVEVVLDDVVRIDAEQNQAIGKSRSYPYDALIIAAGATHSYFGNEGWEEFAPGLKTLEQATEIRRRILTAYEAAEKCEDPLEQKAWLTFAVIGAGPTGVELAGSLAELAHATLAKDFRKIRSKETAVYLVEGGPRVLASFHPDLSVKARKDLEALGVQVLLNSKVQDVDADGLTLPDRRIAAKTLLWAAGVRPSKLSESITTPRDRVGRMIVKEDCSLPSYPKIYAIGDIAAFTGSDGKPLPGVAPVAVQQGAYVARSLVHQLDGKPKNAFQYFDKGSMATIGRKKAVLEVGSLRLTGVIAWLGWLFVHLLYLVGFKNRVTVLFSWIWSYFTYRRESRIIPDREWRMGK